MTLPQDTTDLEVIVASGIRKTLATGSVEVDFGSAAAARNFRFKVYDIVKAWRMRRGKLPLEMQGELEKGFQNVALTLEKASSLLVWKDRRRLPGAQAMLRAFGEEIGKIEEEIAADAERMQDIGARLLGELGDAQAAEPVSPVALTPSPYPTRGG